MSELAFTMAPEAQARQAWLEERRAGIGGSDAAPILGLSKWKTPLDIYRDKRGLSIPSEPTDAMAWGTALEPVIREWYERQTGRRVTVPAGILRHPGHDWMVASLDGIVPQDRVLEIKTARSTAGWGEPGTDQIPQAYLIQVQHYLAVTALPVADVAVLFGGQDAQLYEVPADAELQAMLIEEEARFWANLREGIEPAPVSYADAVAKWGRARPKEDLVAGHAERELVQMLKDIRSKIDDLQTQEEDLKLEVCKAIEDRADRLIEADGTVLCTWKATVDSKKTDWEAVAKALGATHDLIEANTVVRPGTRRFLLK